MTSFIRLLSDQDKHSALQVAAKSFRNDSPASCLFNVSSEKFREIPGSPFAYWVSEDVLSLFSSCARFEQDGRAIRVGLATTSDPIFVRLWYELNSDALEDRRWIPYAKGGSYSPYYQDVHLVVSWKNSGQHIKARVRELGDSPSRYVASEDRYFQKGLTYPRRTQKGFNVRVLPSECIFGNKGPSIFVESGEASDLMAMLALMNSAAFQILLSMQMAFGSFEVGVVQRTPWPKLDRLDADSLSSRTRRIWLLKRKLDSIQEISHTFTLPVLLSKNRATFETEIIDAEIAGIQREIDAIVFDLYGFKDGDRTALSQQVDISDQTADTDAEAEDDEASDPADERFALLSWCVGVAVGRFDLRLATGDRDTPPEPDPFDPLPVKSPGMLPDGAEPFHMHVGILVDDPGHPHDLARLVEEVLERVEIAIPIDARRWLQREFFVFHLQHYSKNRRKAPVYWPLATASGSYILWLYYPGLNSQTLYTAINDFVEPKLKQVGDDVAALRNKGAARSRDDEKQFETLQAFELELIELRDTLLKIAQGYQPNHDDGVQITAAPLWPLFRHKPWQKILKDTWAKLEKGDYDWAHLAMSYWPGRVREKCKTDKSLAIAHDLEALYVEREAKPKKTCAKKT